MILGAGGMGREVLSYYKDVGKAKKVGGFVEQHSSRAGQKISNELIFDELELPIDKSLVMLIAGIGNPMRRKWIEELEAKGYRFDTLVHDRAYVGDNVKIGAGSIICPDCILTCDISIGGHCIINVKASISHDCIVGNFVSIAPGANIGGRVTIGDESWVGIGSTLIQDVRIGRGVFIGAGAVVVGDIPDNSLVVGVPAKVVRELSVEDWKTII